MFAWALCFLLLKMHKKSEEGGPDKCHSRYRKEFFNNISSVERRLRSRRIPRVSLLSLPDPPWQKLLTLQVNQAMITMNGFDCVSFQSLLQKFALIFDQYTPFNKSHITLKANTSKGGCPRMVHPEDCLGKSIASNRNVWIVYSSQEWRDKETKQPKWCL
jgi:hypothetical protein